MKRHLMAAAAILFSPFGADDAFADDEAKSPVAVSGNAGVVSDYVFRGLTQTWGKPAVQGGIEAAAGGFVAGAWASGVSEHSYPGGTMELDLYASYGRAVNDDWSWRAGVYGYVYPGANLDQAHLPARSFDTLEANASVSWKRLTLKYSRAATDYFGADREQAYAGATRGTGYLQLDTSLPVADRWSMDLHVGRTRYRRSLAQPLASGERNPSYSDYGVTLKYQAGERWSVALGLTHATNGDFYRRTSSFIQAEAYRHAGGTRGFMALQGSF